MVCCRLCSPVCLKLYLFYLQLYSLVCLQVIAATGESSQIRISLDPQPALIGEDVQIRCTLVQIPVQPRIAVNNKEETLQSLANRDKYNLTSSTNTDGVAVYVLTLHNVSVSDNGTRFECFVRQPKGRIITSGTRVLRVVQERITVTKVHRATSLQETSVLLTEILTSQRISSIQPSSSNNIHLLSLDKSEMKSPTNTKSHQMMSSKTIQIDTEKLHGTGSDGHVHSSTVIVASICAIIGGILVIIIIVSSICLFVKAVKRTKGQSDRSTDSDKESSPAILEVTVATGPHYESIVQKGGRRIKSRKSGRKVTEKSYENVPSDHISHHINSSRDHKEGVDCKQNQGSTPQTAPNILPRQTEEFGSIAPAKKKRFVSREETIQDLNMSLSRASPLSPEIKQTLNKKGYEVMEAVEEQRKEPGCGINTGGGCHDGDQYIELASVKKSKVTMRQPADQMMNQPADPMMKEPADPMMKQPADPMMKEPSDLMMKEPADLMMKQPADPKVVNDCIGCAKVGLKPDVSPRHSYEAVVLPQPPADLNK